MICPRCGANFTRENSICPYCRTNINTAHNQKREIDRKLEKRLEYVDKVFQIRLEQDFYLKTVNELERYYNHILNLYISNKDKLGTEDLKEINSHLFDVFETLQRNYPYRKDIEKVINEAEASNNFKNNYEFIDFLLNKCNPAQVNAAAFKLRSSCERALQEVHNYDYRYVPEKKCYLFEKKYRQMFLEITKSNSEADKLCEYHKDLNLFVHENKKNDLILMKKFKTQEQIVMFLNEVMQTHVKYNLI